MKGNKIKGLKTQSLLKNLFQIKESEKWKGANRE